MKKQLWNEKWEINNNVVTLPRDEMLLTERNANAPTTDAQGFFGVGKYVYEKRMGVNAKHAFLNFDGVYKNAHVYLNDEEKEFVPYGYVPFLVDLGSIKEDDVIKVECDNLDQPDSRWYSGAGIYRDVHLYTADGDYIHPNGIKVDTLDYKEGKIRITCKTSNGIPTVEIVDGDEVVAHAQGNEVEFTIANPKLWNENHPNLYKCIVKLENDEAEIKFGIRQVEKRKDGLYINGIKTLLRGGCIHHDNGLLGSATYAKSEYRRIKILKEAGFNAIRSSHNPTSEALLNACDGLGIYVMDEMWDMWFHHKNTKDYATYWREYHMSDIQKVVERDYNHPSVIFYSIGNEVSEPAKPEGVQAVKEMVDYFHELDKNKLVTGGFNLMIITNAAKGKGIYKEEGGLNNDNKTTGMNSTVFNIITSFIGSGMNKSANSKKADEICSQSLDLLDISGYNYASGRYPLDAKLHPDRLIFGSETMPYTIGQNWKMVEELDNLIGDFMWTAWDYMGENGIGGWNYSSDGRGFSKPYPWWLADTGAFDIVGNPNAEAGWAMATWKMTDRPLIYVQPINHDLKLVKAAWRGTNGLPSYSWKNCDGRKAVVEVFYPADKITLIQNGKTIKTVKVKENRAKFKVTYHPGELEAIAYDINNQEVARGKIKSASSNVSVQVKAEEDSIKVNDIVYVNVTLEDENGIVESNADRKVKVEVEGGELLAFGSANPRLTEDLHAGEFSTYYGRALAIIKATKPGNIIVKADDSTATIKVEE